MPFWPDRFHLETVRSGTAAVPFVGVLDGYSPDFAWSHWRALVSSFTGTILQVQRTSDNVPFDVPQNASREGDITALLSFVGSDSASVASVSEQVQGKHMLQGTVDRQRVIVDAGTLVTVGGKAASKGVSGQSCFLATDALASTYTGASVSVFIRGQHAAYIGAVYDAYLGLARDALGIAPGRPPLLAITETQISLAFVNFSGGIVDDYLVSVIWDGTHVTLRDGTNTYVEAYSGAFDFNRFVWAAYDAGGNGEQRSDHSVQEMAVWLSDQTANEEAIRSAMMA